jgi:hypothetical protein
MSAIKRASDPGDREGIAEGAEARQSTKVSVCVCVLTFTVPAATKNVWPWQSPIEIVLGPNVVDVVTDVSVPSNSALVPAGHALPTNGHSATEKLPSP